MNPEVAQLRTIPLFQSMSDSELERLAGWSEIRTCEGGERLTPEGASGYTFFVIQDGTAQVRQDGEPIGELDPGDFFGEIAILGDGRRSADVVATTPMSVVAMFGQYFREMEREMPEVAARIREAMERRLKA